MEKAVIYARFSSDRQTDASIDAQVRACREYAANKGINVVKVYADEAISGKGSKTASRAQYQKMLRESEKGHFSIILIHKYDRVARNLGEHVNLEAKMARVGVKIIAVAQDFGTSNEAKIMRAMMWSFSEYYIDNLAQEVKKGHKENALKALHNGGVALFGYDVEDKRYVINELEAAYVRRAFMAVKNREGFTKLLKEMEERGIKGKRGKAIKYTQLYEMLRNEKYTGVYIYSQTEEEKRGDRRTKPNAIRIENAFPAIIDKALFMEVQQIMNERKQTGKKAGYLCSGLVYCKCGAKMHVLHSRKKNNEYYYFYCSQKCGAPVVRMEEIDNAATEYLNSLLSDENQLQIALAMKEYKANEKGRMDEFKAVLNRKIKEKDDQYNVLMQNLACAQLPPEVVADIGEQMRRIKGEIEQLKNTEPPKDMTIEQISSWLNSLKASRDKEAIRLLIERIDVKTKTDFSITSTLKSVLGKSGCGGRT